jgi:prepilin-type N-terminal cleavage/methylation domain-containing protein/prepilin-type processing-associated H-X9-DG protein
MKEAVMSRYNSTGRRGFTLVEATVVTAVIVVLAAILLPVLARVRAQARLAQCTTNLHNIDLSMRSWAQMNNTGLPNYTTWITVVQTTAQTDRILYCPELPKVAFQAVPFDYPTFEQTKHISNGHPASWTCLSPNYYQCVIQYQKSHPQQATVDFQRRSWDNSWVATVTQLDDEKPWGGPPIDMILSNGTRYNDLKLGQQIVIANGIGGPTYGFNITASNQKYPTGMKVVAMDYDKTTIDYDGQNGDDDTSAKYLVGRHSNKINVLFSDSSIRLLSTSDLAPSTNIYQY